MLLIVDLAKVYDVFFDILLSNHDGIEEYQNWLSCILLNMYAHIHA